MVIVAHGPRKEVAKLVKEVRECGYTVEHEGPHWTVRNAAGKRVGAIPLTPSDHRSLLNCRSRLRRAGVLLD